jgi:hypothetical protein
VTEFWSRFSHAAPIDVQRALRAAVWVLTLAPIAVVHRARTFGRLPADLQDRYLDLALRHRSWAIRELTGVVKLAACLAYFSDPAIRAQASDTAR